MSFINAGHRDFIFVDRTHFGLMFEKYDSCNDETFLKFILTKTNGLKKCELIKYDNCGQTRVTTDSKVLKFFTENREQINRDSIEENVYVDHTVRYSLYEIKNGKLMTYKSFCKECVDWEDKATKEKNQNLKLYQFFDTLDEELSKMIAN